VPSPSVTANGAQDTLSSMTALSGGDIWAVGLSLQNPVSSTLAEHWNGTGGTPARASLIETATG